MSQKDLVDLPGDRELYLELLDPALGRHQLDRLVGAQSLSLTTIDLVLLGPVVDRRFAIAKVRASWFTRVPDRASSMT